MNIWLLVKVVLGDAKTNNLQIAKSTLSNNLTKKSLGKIGSLGKISEKENREFNKIFDEIKLKSGEIEDSLK